MQTRRYPRTMAEAFGPYTSRDLQPMPDKSPDYGAGWWIAITLIALVALFLAAIYR